VPPTATPTPTPSVVTISGNFQLAYSSGDTAANTCTPFGGDNAQGRKYSSDGSWVGVLSATLCLTNLAGPFYELFGVLAIELDATRLPYQTTDGCVMQVLGAHNAFTESLHGVFRPSISTYVITNFDFP
jgi:hypothetical protein